MYAKPEIRHDATVKAAAKITESLWNVIDPARWSAPGKFQLMRDCRPGILRSTDHTEDQLDEMDMSDCCYHQINPLDGRLVTSKDCS